jgi:hypothetical protein
LLLLLGSVGDNNPEIGCLLAFGNGGEGYEFQRVGAGRLGDAALGEAFGESSEFLDACFFPQFAVGASEELWVFGQFSCVTVDGGSCCMWCWGLLW